MNFVPRQSRPRGELSLMAPKYALTAGCPAPGTLRAQDRASKRALRFLVRCPTEAGGQTVFSRCNVRASGERTGPVGGTPASGISELKEVLARGAPLGGAPNGYASMVRVCRVARSGRLGPVEQSAGTDARGRSPPRPPFNGCSCEAGGVIGASRSTRPGEHRRGFRSRQVPGESNVLSERSESKGSVPRRPRATRDVDADKTHNTS